MMTRESHDSIADHYQQASLHLEAAAGHLFELQRRGQEYLIQFEVGKFKTAVGGSELILLSRYAEQRAQAALQETNGHP